ncbi:unnamed protein product, partial [Rotaria sordida]
MSHTTNYSAFDDDDDDDQEDYDEQLNVKQKQINDVIA